MKAAIINRFGDPSVLELAVLPKPVPKRGELLIRIEAAGLNRLDHYIREGGVNPALKFPHVLGSDAAGVVEAVGEEVTGFDLGDRVLTMPGYPMDPSDDGAEILALSRSYAIRGLVEQGTYAEFMVAPARWTLKDRTGLPAVEAAALPMPLVTAVRSVKVVGCVNKGDKVLIHAGASGTGSMMIQVAKALGASVATTIRTESKADFVRRLGADLVVNMSDDNFVSQVHEWSDGGVDVAVDNLGGPSLARSLEAVKPLGVVVLMGNVLGLDSTIPVRSVFFPQRQIRGAMGGEIEDFLWGLDLVRAGKIRPTLDRTFRLEEAAVAHRRLVDGQAVGNIVFDNL